MIAKEGLLYGIILLILGISFLLTQQWTVAVVFIVIAFAIFLFFRQPKRTAHEGNGLVYAPCDGRVIQIKEEYEDTFFREVVQRISIFMSIFNVHINYAPITGSVEYIKYSPGDFKRADIAEGNENNFIVITNGEVKVGVRQVAGWIARRIVCDCKVGDSLSCGRRFGLVKFGSRIDVYFSKDFTIYVNVGDKVRAGRTVLSEKNISIA